MARNGGALPAAIAAAFGIAAALFFCVVPLAFVGSSRLQRLQKHSLRIATAATPSGVLTELLVLANAEDAGLAKAVDDKFGKLTPQDLSMLDARLKSADETEQQKFAKLQASIQVSMEKRMESAKQDIDDLLKSSGNIDDNIRETLGKQESPLPIMALMQMNMAAAQQKGQEKQLQALAYVFNGMNTELEKQVPVANRVLMKLLGMEDKQARREVLVNHVGQGGNSKELAEAIVKLVADAEEQFATVGSGPEGETRSGTLELIRKVAIDAALMIGEELGDSEQDKFTEQLQPLFDAMERD